MYGSEVNKINGVVQIKIDVPFPMKFVAIYLFKVDNSYVMFDAGFNRANWNKVFFSALKDLNISFKEIDYCIISHEHLDHIGLIRKFRRKNPNIKVMMSEVTHETLIWETDPKKFSEMEEAAKDEARLMVKFGMSEDQAKRLVEWSTMWPKLRKYNRPDKILYDGDEISFKTNKLSVIWTPGHSLGHICIFDNQKKYLFSGDHILSRITPHIGNFLVNPTLEEKYDFTDILDHYLNSLDRIDKLAPSIIFPAHQDIIYNPHERILEIKEHHANRLREISSMIRDKPLTPVRIAQLHFGELDEINSILALSEVLGHLIYLENKDEAERIEKNGKILFKSL